MEDEVLELKLLKNRNLKKRQFVFRDHVTVTSCMRWEILLKHGHILYITVVAMSKEERISSQTKSHPLFPILQHIAVSVRNCKLQVESIDTRTKKTEQDLNSVVSVQREL